MPTQLPPSWANPPVRVARRRAWLCSAALFLLSAAPGAEEAVDATQALLKCLELRDPQQRLACYDRMASTVIELGLTLPDDIAEAAGAPAATAAAPTATVPTPKEEFGLELKREAEIDSISANVVGGFAGWGADTVFELDNGQVWQQSAAGRFEYAGPDRRVTIRRAAFGSFLLSPEGLNRTVRVQRIK